MLAVAETWENGKPVRGNSGRRHPTRHRPLPLLRRLIRAQEGTASPIDDKTIAYHFHEPLGRGRPDHPLELPPPDGDLEARPRLAAGNCVVIKPAEQTPATLLVLMELIGDLLPPGVLNVVNGFGVEAGKPLRLQPPYRQDRL